MARETVKVTQTNRESEFMLFGNVYSYNILSKSTSVKTYDKCNSHEIILYRDIYGRLILYFYDEYMNFDGGDDRVDLLWVFVKDEADADEMAEEGRFGRFREPCIAGCGTSWMAVHRLVKYDKISKKHMEKLSRRGVANLMQIGENSLRGSSLAMGKTFKLLSTAETAGIERIIDLRTTDHTENFSKQCEEEGFDYFHIPVDSRTVPDEEIIRNLPVLIEAIDAGSFYISCSEGLYRTDIALALYWLFHPQSVNPPALPGHVKDGRIRYDDIFRRANSIFRRLTEENLKSMGWDSYPEATFKQRKTMLIQQLKIQNK